jgi:DNA replication protein DnaC
MKPRPITELKIHEENLIRGTIQNIERKTGLKGDLNSDQLRVIKQVALWFCGEYKTGKGILLIGSKGTGKTTIMQVIIAYYTFVFQKVIITTYAKALPSTYKKHGLEYFYKRPWFVDDLGKEPETTMDWGHKFDTWADVFSIRYENQALTFATGNYLLDGEYLKIYGEVVCDRMKEHFNIFQLTGESLRK